MNQTLAVVAEREGLENPVSLGQAFLGNCQRWGATKVALRHKRYGLWNKYTWADSYEQVRAFALGLLSLGLQHDEKMAILGDIEPELYWGMFAAWTLGVTTVGCHVDALHSEVQYAVDHSDSSFVLARDQEQVDKLLRIKDELPKVRRVIWWDPRGMRHYHDPWLISFKEVIALGEAYGAEHPRAFEESIARTTSDQVAAMYYTSGSTGQPKACCHSHRTLMGLVDRTIQSINAGPDDDAVCNFSIGSAGEPQLGSVAHLLHGLRVNIPEEPETMMADLREIAPTFVSWMPRQWEGIASTIQINVGEADLLKRFFYNQFLKVGYRYDAFLSKGERPSLLWRSLHYVGEYLVFRPVRDRVGLTRLKKGLNSGYTLGVETFKFMRALGIDLREFYGLSEMGYGAGHVDGQMRPGSVGAVLSDCKAKISPEGELLFQCPSIFIGYYKNPAATDKVVKDGWFHTGDAAYIDEHNHIFLYDRLSEMGELANGAKYAPQFIEAQLRFGAHIRDAVAVGGKRREYVTAVITLDFQAAAKWAEHHNLMYKTQLDLSQKDQIAERVTKEFQRVNQTLPKEARIRKFVVLHKEFDADEGELTRTRKVKRTLVESRYADLIEAMYSGQSEVQVSALVTYQDGRTGTVTAGVRVREVPDVPEKG